MKARFFLFSVAAFIAAAGSCTKEEVAVDVVAPEEGSEVIVDTPADTVVFSASTKVITRTDFSDNGDNTYTILWKAGDAINVNGISLSLQTTDQPDGYGPGQTRGNFSGPWAPSGNGSSPIYKVVYPASIFGTPGSLPTEQTYVSGDNIANFPMYAESDTKSFEFHNLCGIIRIGLKGDTRSVSSITLVDTDDTPKPLSGPYTVSSNTAVISSGTNGTSLICSPAVALNASDFEYFNITVPANTYGKLKIMIEATDGYIWTLTAKNAITVERSKITPINLSSPKFKNEKEQIYYTTYNGAKINKFAGGDDASVFGTGLSVISHTYEGGVGTITLDGPVTKIGDSAFNGLSGIVTMTIPSTVTSIGGSAFRSLSKLTTLNIPDGVTSIGDMAFQGCSSFNPAGQLDNITSFGGACLQNTLLNGDLILSTSVTKVDNYAFRETRITTATFEGTPATLGNFIFQSCGSLREVTFEDDIHITTEMFLSCGALETVTFNGDCTTVGNNAFKNCSSLVSISFPESLTSLGTYVFAGCTSLKTVGFGATPTITTIPSYCFDGCTAMESFTFPSSITTVQNNAFQGCTSLESVVFPTNPSFTTIPRACFQNCTSLTTADIPSNVTTISYEAFKNCGFTAPPSGWERNGITYTGGNNVSAFMGCPITSIRFPDNWTSVPSYFCVGWAVLEEVDFGSNITAIGNNAFQGCASLTDGSKIDVSQITNFGARCFYQSRLTSLPAGINRSGLTIGEGIFMDAKSLTTVNLSNWTATPYQCFRGCTNITDVDLSGVNTMGGYAFVDCSNLATVVLGSSLTEMGGDCFNGCYSVDITIHATTPPSVGRLIYSWSNFVPTIHVPASAVETYKVTSPWSNYASSITAISE